jgi:hypothetical protein
MKMRNMKITLALTSLLTVLILILLGVVPIPPRVAHAQAIGYVLSGQQNVTATAAVVTGTSYGSICIKALAGNSINVYLGGKGVTDSTGMELAAGNSYCAPNNSNEFYVVASTTGASVSWIVSR